MRSTHTTSKTNIQAAFHAFFAFKTTIMEANVPNYLFAEKKKSRNREIFEQWELIQEIIGPAHLWPHFIRRLFWTRGIKHDKRPIFSAFVFVNGLDPIVHVL